MLSSPVDRAAVAAESIKPSRAIATLVEDVRAGLLHAPRELPPKYFYDTHGSSLFEAICLTPEYYPTRAERALIAQHAHELMGIAQPLSIVEFGSGVASKLGPLFKACEAHALPASYYPFDVCESVLLATGELLREQFPWLVVRPLLGDFTAGLANLPQIHGRKLLMFLGGTLGNFDQPAAIALLAEMRTLMRPDDFLLLGADRVKDPLTLHAAYNDAAGLTAQFNLNLLSVLNAGVGADFVADNFAHRAFYNAEAQRIEMHLESLVAQRVALPALGESINFAAGETIRTEISRKFSPASLSALLAAAGLRLDRHFSGVDEAFSLVLARRDDA